MYNTEKKQYEYELLLDLNKREKRKFFLARDMGFYKVFRKEITFFAMYLLGELTNNLSNLWNIDEKLFRNVLPEEYDFSMIKKIAKKRKEELIYLVNDDSEEIIVGKEAREILSLVKGKKVEPITKEYHEGSTAHPGKAIGKAKLVMGVNHLSKVQEGDILVSFSTNPQMIIAMGKAKAIITEQGGIACHAAIVAREMKKPCVVGIDDLTQIINDGDLLEVNADEGFVRIIEKHQNDYKL